MFGELTITNSKLLGGWELKLQKADKLPQGLTTAFNRLYGEKFGGNYVPVYYVATQPVNGVNHKLIVERNKLVSGGKVIKDFAVVVINIPAGDVRAERATVVSEEDTTDFVLRDEIEQGVKKAFKEYTGVGLKPLLEVGTQVVRGMNYVFICEANIIYKEKLDPYLTKVIINNFKDNWVIVDVKALS